MKTPSFWNKNSAASGTAVASPDTAPPRTEPDFSAEKYTVPAARPAPAVGRQRDRPGENPATPEQRNRVETLPRDHAERCEPLVLRDAS